MRPTLDVPVCESRPVDSVLTARAAVFDRLLVAWNDGDPDAVLDLITEDYRGHMLHLPKGERSAAECPQWSRDDRGGDPRGEGDLVHGR